MVDNYVARRDCGCIVAAFPMNRGEDKRVAEIIKQLILMGYQIHNAPSYDVRLNFKPDCECGKQMTIDFDANKADDPESSFMDAMEAEAEAWDIYNFDPERTNYPPDGDLAIAGEMPDDDPRPETEWEENEAAIAADAAVETDTEVNF